MDEMEKINNKIARFPRKKSSLQRESFSYKVIKKDVNGLCFNFDHLKDYSLGIKYTITLALNEKDKTILHQYLVEGENLKDFFKACIDGKIEGDIIEIDKTNPEILA